MKLTVNVSQNSWSYITNEKNNSLRFTLEGYGSCIPKDILEQWLHDLSDEEIAELSKQCDETKDLIV